MAAVSDLHLGAPGSYFVIPGLQDRLWEGIRQAIGGKKLDLLILNGDVLDLAVSRHHSAYRAGRQFFNELAKTSILDVSRVLYIVGNHDHHLWTVIEEARMCRHFPEIPGERDGLSSYAQHGSAPESGSFCYAGDSPFAGIFPERLHDRLVFAYPFHAYTENSAPATPLRWFFHHGHYFDPYITPLKRDVARMGDLRGLEVANAAYLEALFYYLSWDTEQLEKGLYIVDLLPKYASYASFALRALGLDRSKSQAGVSDWKVGGHDGSEIERVLRNTPWRNKGAGVRERRVFVFGHSHIAGKKIRPEGEYYDLGGWVLESRPNTPIAEQRWARPAFFYRRGSTWGLTEFGLTEADRKHLMEVQ
ncbi:MAG TPA: metallophosphoesterase [Phycisphaerae bacterium]|nr:metallophosphoesterase [Phycisphaerae bacterium]